MLELPIDSFLPAILDQLRSHPSLVLVAPPGAGKTTRVAPAILKAGLLPPAHPAIIMLQPRRVAARAAAQRIAQENGWLLGQEVGYHIRFEKRYGPATQLRVLTEAILTRMLLSDPFLENVGCVILDEFHERNLHTDLAVAFLREIQQTVRPDLKIVVMSATLDAQPVARFLAEAPVIVTEGRNYPLEILYRPGRDERLERHVARTITEALQRAGDILVFLPGAGEIEKTRRELQSLELHNVALLPLHGSLSAEDQQRALRPDPDRRRKIVLATNIAETSLTIDGVRIVVDSGLARVASFDADRGMDRLDLERISQASAAQRAGRAGRQAQGSAMRLWSEPEQKHLPPFNVPEIKRVDLAWTLLAVHAWGSKNPQTFDWFEAPPEPKIAAAERLLEMLGALHDGAITSAGRQMLDLPLHPRTARLLLAAAGTALLPDAVTLAARLSDDARRSPDSNPLEDSAPLPPHLQQAREQLRNVARRLPAQANPRPAADLGELLLLAYPDRVARRRGADPHAAIMVGGVGLRLAPAALTPAIAASPLFLALETHHDPRNPRAESRVHAACAVTPQSLERLFPEQLRTQTTLEFDAQREKVTANTRHYFNDLQLSEDAHGLVDRHAAGIILATAIADRAAELFAQDEAASRLLARAALLRHNIPEGSAGQPWPAFDEGHLRTLLMSACAGKLSLAELLAGSHLADALRQALPYPLDRELERLAPETIEVPSGSRIRLDYAPPSANGTPPPPPILAVRLQELFGWTQTPRIAAGRVPLVLHLLSPGFKPIQITSDLQSFWASAYFAVRKDLRARYPKHKWPDDPLGAAPEAKGRPRR